MLKTYKYRLYPTSNQIVLFEKHFGCARFVYNWGLQTKIDAYQKESKSLSFYSLIPLLAKLKSEPGKEWLYEVNSQSLQNSLFNLDKAFTKFFRDKKGFPKFKSKKNNRQSFQIPQNTKIDFESNRISVPKIKSIKAKISRKFEGKIKTSTISKTPTGKFFISILVETPDDIQSKPSIKENKTIGIDLGLTHLAILSNGIKIDSPKFLKKSSHRLKLLQRRLSRKVKGSNNRNKSRLKVALLHEEIENQRLDFLHKLTYFLTHDNQVDTICLENLNISGMLKNHKLACSISDASWSKFIELLKYKCDWYGKNLLFIGRFEPSSKMCSCGAINQLLTLADRSWICPSCKTLIEDRDIHAALNIKKFALQKQNIVGWESPEFTLAKYDSFIESGQESFAFRQK